MIRSVAHKAIRKIHSSGFRHCEYYQRPPEREDVRPCCSDYPTARDLPHASDIEDKYTSCQHQTMDTDNREEQKGKDKQNDNNRTSFTPHQKLHIDQQINAIFDYRIEAFRAQMSGMIDEQMRVMIESLRESNKSGNGSKFMRFFRKIGK